MTKTALLALTLAAALPAVAHADAVNDRVYLLTGGSSGCPSGQLGYHRILQSPDGGVTTTGAEFQVPVGKFLEVTSIEYELPMYMPWATSYTQTFDVTARGRTTNLTSGVFSARYSNSPIFVAERGGWEVGGEYTSPGAETRVASFPSGPLVGNGARICLAATNNFRIYGGDVRIRGRLIPADATIQPPPGGGTLP